MSSEQRKTDDAAEVGDAADLDGLLKAAWDRRMAEPVPPDLTDHVDRLIAEDTGEAEG